MIIMDLEQRIREDKERTVRILKSLGRGTMAAGRAVDYAKRRLEPGLDKVMLAVAANSGIAYAAANYADQSHFSDPSKAVIMMGAGAALAALNYAAFVTDNVFARVARRMTSASIGALDRIRPLSWLKTGAVALAMYAGATGLVPYAAQVRDDFSTALRGRPPAESTMSETRIAPVPVRNRPAIYDIIGYTPIVEHDFTGVSLAEKNSAIGRLQRTLRWQPIYHAIEKRYGLPTNTLGAMIMQESYGDPVQPNATNDGGLGLIHIQGTTARQWGLLIFGNSTRDSDNKHGNQLAAMLKNCKYDPVCVEKQDERVHLIKDLDAGGRIISTNSQDEDADAGIMAYRGGRLATRRAYLRDVKRWRELLGSKERVRKAEEDFNARNRGKYVFQEYLRDWHAMSNNWGLKEYESWMGGRNRR
jgi:hypothetical protein